MLESGTLPNEISAQQVVRGRLRFGGQSTFVARSFEQRLWDEWRVKGELMKEMKDDGCWGLKKGNCRGEILKREGQIKKKFTIRYVKRFLIFYLFKIVSTQVGSAFSYKPRQQGLIYLAISWHSSASLVRASLYQSCTTCTSKMTSSKQCHFESGLDNIYFSPIISARVSNSPPPPLPKIV